jgi:hypothetical protein
MLPWTQSVTLAGSLSWSPWKSGPPVHWLVSTRSRTKLALTLGMSKERRFSTGAIGRGALPGKASLALV